MPIALAICDARIVGIPHFKKNDSQHLASWVVYWKRCMLFFLFLALNGIFTSCLGERIKGRDCRSLEARLK